MVSDVYEFNIPEVRLFFRFCERKDSDTLRIGKKRRKACACFSCSSVISDLSSTAAIHLNQFLLHQKLDQLFDCVTCCLGGSITFACSINWYVTFSFSLLFLFVAWEGPHHPRNLLLGVVYTAKVSPYQTHLICGLWV